MKHPSHAPNEHSSRERTILPAEDTDFEDDPELEDDEHFTLEDELEDELARPDVQEDDDQPPIVEEQRQHPGS